MGNWESTCQLSMFQITGDIQVGLRASVPSPSRHGTGLLVLDLPALTLVANHT